MARAAVKAKQAAKPKPKPQRGGRRRHASGGNPNQELFFTRLRTHAKWVYVLLAVLFAVTFAFLGVGSGSSGLDQLFSGLNFFGGGGPSVSKAQKYIRDHPNEAKGFRDLATAYESKGDTPNAISALQQLTLKRPKDVKAWSELAGLQQSQAQAYLQDYQNAYQLQQLASPSAAFLPTGKLATAIGTNKIEEAQSSTAQAAVADSYQKVQGAYNGAIQSWTELTKLQPKNSNVWFSLGGAAQTAGDYATAIKAYTQYLKLNPEGTSAAQIKALIKQLKASSSSSP
jgi:tetratricopeptide (TPR) repeat protein